MMLSDTGAAGSAWPQAYGTTTLQLHEDAFPVAEEVPVS
jgi:hypothetical protein